MSICRCTVHGQNLKGVKSNARRFDGGKKCCLVNLKPFFLTVVCPSLLVSSYLAFLIEKNRYFILIFINEVAYIQHQFA